jgi:hypothetical protein
LQPEDLAAAALFAVDTSLAATPEEIVVRPTVKVF